MYGSASSSGKRWERNYEVFRVFVLRTVAGMTTSCLPCTDEVHTVLAPRVCSGTSPRRRTFLFCPPSLTRYHASKAVRVAWRATTPDFFFILSGAIWLEKFQACGTDRLGFGRSFSADQQLVSNLPIKALHVVYLDTQHTTPLQSTTYQHDPNPRARLCLTV